MDIDWLFSKGFRMDWFEQIPAGVFVVSHDGTFIKCNNRALRLFGLTSQVLQARSANILDYYHEPQDREELQRKVLEAEEKGHTMERQKASFHVGGRDLILEINSRSIRDQNGGVVGYVDCIMDVTEEAHYHQLLDSLGEGVFQVDSSSSISMANAAVARLFGYDRSETLVGRPIADFFADPADADALRSSVEAEADDGEVVWSMVRLDRRRIFASIRGFLVPAPPGEYAGFEATIRDVTLTEEYRTLIHALPVGFYMLQRTGEDDVVQHCNREFAQLFGFQSEADVLGKPMKELHADTSHYDAFLGRADAADREGKPLLNDRIRIRTHNGRNLWVEVNCRLLRNHLHEEIGRVGVIRDVTDEEPLRRQTKKFAGDIGNLLHSYSSTLHTVATSLPPAITALLRGPGERLPAETSELVEAATHQAKQLANSVTEFLSARTGDNRLAANLHAEQWDLLHSASERLLSAPQEVALPDMVLPTYYDIATEVEGIFEGLRKHVDRTSLREVSRQAWLLERIAALAGLYRAREASIVMDYSARALREYVIRGERPVDPRAEHRVVDLIASAIHNVADFIREKRIRVERTTSRNVTVQVEEREVVRALANVIHNAIKYSWSREGREPWIDIRATAEQPPRRSAVRIEVENYGVPIPADEIKEGHIFRLGFRGRLASERRRIGTGVGLTDAKEVVERHGGELSVLSRPARGHSAEDYSQPFITTVTIHLPVTKW